MGMELWVFILLSVTVVCVFFVWAVRSRQTGTEITRRREAQQAVHDLGLKYNKLLTQMIDLRRDYLAVTEMCRLLQSERKEILVAKESAEMALHLLDEMEN